MHKKELGSLGEAIVISQAIENGCAVFPEFGDNSKIDLIIESKNGSLYKVQVKLVTRENKTPNVSHLYLYKNGPGYSFVYEEKMVDWFALVDFTTKKIAWIQSSILQTNKTRLSLRHTGTKNKQSKSIKYFDDYTQFPFA